MTLKFKQRSRERFFLLRWFKEDKPLWKFNLGVPDSLKLTNIKHHRQLSWFLVCFVLANCRNGISCLKNYVRALIVYFPRASIERYILFHKIRHIEKIHHSPTKGAMSSLLHRKCYCALCKMFPAIAPLYSPIPTYRPGIMKNPSYKLINCNFRRTVSSKSGFLWGQWWSLVECSAHKQAITMHRLWLVQQPFFQVFLAVFSLKLVTYWLVWTLSMSIDSFRSIYNFQHLIRFAFDLYHVLHFCSFTSRVISLSAVVLNLAFYLFLPHEHHQEMIQ